MAGPVEPIETESAQRARCDIYLREFAALKAEQVQRISFRDNMLYVTLVAVGGIATFALGGAQDVLRPSVRMSALLVIPWICAVLGWTYVVNDEKISAIGDYIKAPGGLADRIHAIVGGERSALFGWETAHASDDWRLLRKLSQLVVDLATFVVSGVVAIYAFDYASRDVPHSPAVKTLMYGEGLLLAVLAVWIVKYSGAWRGHGKARPAPPKGDAG